MLMSRLKMTISALVWAIALLAAYTIAGGCLNNRKSVTQTATQSSLHLVMARGLSLFVKPLYKRCISQNLYRLKQAVR
jgi:hypothetical protein